MHRRLAFSASVLLVASGCGSSSVSVPCKPASADAGGPELTVGGGRLNYIPTTDGELAQVEAGSLLDRV